MPCNNEEKDEKEALGLKRKSYLFLFFLFDELPIHISMSELSCFKFSLARYNFMQRNVRTFYSKYSEITVMTRSQ